MAPRIVASDFKRHFRYIEGDDSRLGRVYGDRDCDRARPGADIEHPRSRASRAKSPARPRPRSRSRDAGSARRDEPRIPASKTLAGRRYRRAARAPSRRADHPLEARDHVRVDGHRAGDKRLTRDSCGCGHQQLRVQPRVLDSGAGQTRARVCDRRRGSRAPSIRGPSYGLRGAIGVTCSALRPARAWRARRSADRSRRRAPGRVDAASG